MNWEREGITEASILHDKILVTLLEGPGFLTWLHFLILLQAKGLLCSQCRRKAVLYLQCMSMVSQHYWELPMLFTVKKSLWLLSSLSQVYSFIYQIIGQYQKQYYLKVAQVFYLFSCPLIFLWPVYNTPIPCFHQAKPSDDYFCLDVGKRF